MSKRLGYIALLFAAAAFTCANSTAQDTQDAQEPGLKLAKMVTEAAGNSDKLLAAAQFAKANKLDDKAIELFESVLEVKPECKEAHEALGHKLEDGLWFATIDGLKLPAREAADARKGIYDYNGDKVTRWEKERLDKGYIRHKWTQLLVAPEHAEKANAGQFPLEDGKWGDFAAAAKYHGNNGTPWVVRTNHFYIVTSLPYTTITKDIWQAADSVYSTIRMICGGNDPAPTKRPVVWVVPTTSDYQDFGNNYGAEGSAHGAFFADPNQYTITIEGTSFPVAAANWGATGWGPYYVRHGAGLALARSFLGSEANSVPDWFHRALAGYSSRLYNPQIASFFAKQHIKAGPPEDLGKWISGFTISGNNPVSGKGTNDYNIFQAGLLIHFCMRGGDSEATDALMEVTKAIAAQKDMAAAVRKLQEVLGNKTDEVNAYLEKIAG